MRKLKQCVISCIQAFTSRVKVKGVQRILDYCTFLFNENEPVNAYKGVKLFIDPKVGFHVRNMFCYMGFEEVLVFEKFLIKGNFYIDVGGNLGYLALNAERLVGKDGLVIALEPDVTILPLLRRNLEHNKSTIRVVEIAASSERGSVTFNIATESGLSRLENSSKSSFGMELLQKTEVQADTLDNIVAEQAGDRKVDFIKIDVEGHELTVLKGATSILKKDGPTLILEVNARVLASNGLALDDLVDYLKPFGYKFFKIEIHGKAWFRIGRAPTYIPIEGDLDRFKNWPFDMLCVHPKSSPDVLAHQS